MDLTYRFRHSLLRRLLSAAGVVALTAPVLHGAACGGKVIVDAGDTGGSGTGGAGGEEDVTVTSGPGSTGSNTTGSGCALTSSGASGGQVQLTECIAPVGGSCPNQYEATKFIVPSQSCSYVVSVDCGPVPQGASCCYLVTEEGGGCIGRPFLIDDVARVATVEHTDRGWSLGVLAPDVTGLDAEARRTLAAAWTADALRVFAEAVQHIPAVANDTTIPSSVLLSHGRLDHSAARDALTRTLDDVICPAFASLLHRAPTTVAVASATA